MSKMYVWEVRRYVQHEGIEQLALIRDDENTLKKVKVEVIKHYENYCYYDDIKREQIAAIQGQKFLDDYYSLKFSCDSKIEIEKIEVL